MYTSVSGFMNEGLERQLRDDLILIVIGVFVDVSVEL